MLRLGISVFLLLSMTACYYMQAASGHWALMRSRESIDTVIADPESSPQLVERLHLLTEARVFSVATLGLPDNDSYRSYAQLERDYVVWNVFATPEFSLQPRQWCFPVAGCVNYRGYFSEDAAIAKAQRLRSDGFDVAVAGVAAYSTLGRFDDPVLSTMMQWDDINLVAVLFHELAHQVVYVKDDSSFNESFASAVEEIGIQRWLNAKGDSDDYAKYTADRQSRQRVTQAITAARTDLALTYASDLGEAQMREKKRQRLAQLAAEVRFVPESIDGELNNAHLVTSSLYKARLPQFRAIYARCEQNLECFYAVARSLSKLSAEERNEELASGKFRYFARGLND